MNRFTIEEDRGHRAGGNVFTYRGYRIAPDFDCPMGGWLYSHEQYDGPPDVRCGHAATIEAAVVEIDELCGGWPEKHTYGFDDRPLTCHGRGPDR